MYNNVYICVYVYVIRSLFVTRSIYAFVNRVQPCNVYSNTLCEDFIVEKE